MTMNNQQRSPSLNYWFKLLNITNEQGFTLIELLVVVMIIGMLSVIAIPMYFKQVEKARATEATYTLSSLNKAQQAYRWENGTFAPDFLELGLNMSSPKYYDFSWTGALDASQVHHLATPQLLYQSDLKTYTSAVYRDNSVFYSVLCEGTDVGVAPELVDQATCNNGSILGK